MKLISLLLKQSWPLVILATVLSLINGAANSGLIVLVNTGLNNPGRAGSLIVWGFVGLCIILPLTKSASEILVMSISQRAALELRMRFCGEVLSARLLNLENIGTSRLFAALTADVNTISDALILIPELLTQITIIVGCLAYLAWLSLTCFLGVFIFLVLALCTYQLIVKRGQPRMKLALSERDGLFNHFSSLTGGIKELKLHRPRRLSLLKELILPCSETYRRHNIVGSAIYSLGNSWGVTMSFALLGLIVFGLPLLIHADRQTLAGYTLIILYMVIHLGVLFSVPPALGRANVALNNLESLGQTMAANFGRDDLAGNLELRRSMKTLELVGVTHSYYREAESEFFTLGPIDLSISSGELLFLIGGNGSGKTTLAKLIAGLYVPERGDIRLDGRPIVEGNRDDYRQIFSVVFSDFFLFDRLLGLDSRDLDSRIDHYLSKLQLNHKVHVRDGIFSTTALSQGQRKRLALLTSYLEDRCIYVFDEWASDQDPLFKEVFYLQLLPELKAKGKMVIVISHDERYYCVADRIVKLDYGKIVSDMPIGSQDLQTSDAYRGNMVS